jgi:Tat protein translocase TatB subunit
MFGIGMQEILVLLVIALVVIGPKKLPEMAKALGKGYGEFRRAFEDMRSSINADVKTDEEKERMRESQERVQPPPEAKPAPEAMPVPQKPPDTVAPDGQAPPPESSSPDADETAPSPSSSAVPRSEPSLPVYGTDDEEIEGDGD